MHYREDSTLPLCPVQWKRRHAGHGKGPWYEVKIGIWHIWRCHCGERFHFTIAQALLEPKKYTL